MTILRLMISLCLHKTTGLAVALLVLPLLGATGMAANEAPTPTEPAAETPEVTELKVYKQRVKVSADVVCRVYERRPIFCTANVKQPVMTSLNAELILKYSGFKIGDKEHEAETTPDHTIKFRADKINYTGQQQVDVEVIYVK